MDRPAGEAIFHMKPAAAIETLARIFVDDQRSLAEMREMLEALPADAPADAVSEMRRRLDTLTAQWGREQAPTLAASFRLALEVLDTYGPEGVHVADPTDAAIWNNKYFVWLREFGGRPPDQQHDDGGGQGHDVDRRCGAGIEKATADTASTPGDQVTGGAAMDPLDPRSGEQPSTSEGTAPWTPRPESPDPFGEPAVDDEAPRPADPAVDGDASRSAPADQCGDPDGPAIPAQRPGDPEPPSTAGDLLAEEAPGRGKTKRATQVIAALAVAVAAFLVLGLWKPGFLNTTKLDLTIAQRDIEQLLSDRANGYGLTAVADVKCNNGENPTVRAGATFTCTVSIGGSPRHVTVTFDNSAGDYSSYLHGS